MDQLAYALEGYWREHGDPRIKSNFPLMSGGLTPVILLMTVYLYFVKVLGPRLMTNRKPYNLKWTIRGYNVLVSSLNCYMLYRATILTNYTRNYFKCSPGNTRSEENEFIIVSYLYVLSKVLELLDTVFFVLRKKHNQASKLHIFHHTFMVFVPWMYFKMLPVGNFLVFPYLNSIVHAILYAYYFLATFRSLQRPLSWWKRYVTKLEMAMFVLTVLHLAGQTLAGCHKSWFLIMFGILTNLLFLALFVNFYRRSYREKAPN